MKKCHGDGGGREGGAAWECPQPCPQHRAWAGGLLPLAGEHRSSGCPLEKHPRPSLFSRLAGSGSLPYGVQGKEGRGHTSP